MDVFSSGRGVGNTSELEFVVPLVVSCGRP